MRNLIDNYGNFKANIFFSFTTMILVIFVLEIIWGSSIMNGALVFQVMGISMIQSALQILIIQKNNLKYGNRVGLYLVLLLAILVAFSIIFKSFNVNNVFSWGMFITIFLSCCIASTLGLICYQKLKLDKSV